jgi:lipopolysaccharide/colanic/teichoic acid biosynthesis glycosyltransferase
MKKYGSYLKRLFDVSFALIGFVIVSPILLFLVLRIKIEDGGPVFYCGERVGLRGSLFRIFKFRTMVMDAEKLGASSTSLDDLRITRIGKLIRKYKLDEIPQLINVLKGEMSLVGPRPQVSWAVDLYSEEERKLLSVRPGITDYASIKFRNEGNILKNSFNPDEDYLKKIAPEKIRLGLKYVNNNNMWIDLKIILATIGALFRKGD